MKLSKYISSEVVEIQRSQITFADYNPRIISDEARKHLKANIKRLGVMGGIVWNELTTNLVGGHQKVKILDELHKYDIESQENDYTIRVEKVKLNIKEEIEQNIFLNNKNAQGEYDRDLLGDLIADIDYKLAGLDDYDLNLSGIGLESFQLEDEEPEPLELKKGAKTPEERKADMKDKKEKSREVINDRMQEGETYVMLSFNDFKGKSEFMHRFDLDPMENIISGDEFSDQIERIN